MVRASASILVNQSGRCTFEPCTMSKPKMRPLTCIIREEWNSDKFFVETRTRCDDSRICLCAVSDFKAFSSRERRILTRYDIPCPRVRQAYSGMEKSGGLSALSPETHGDVSEAGLKGERRRQVNDNASYGNSYPGSELEQAFAQGADLGSSTGCPGRPQA